MSYYEHPSRSKYGDSIGRNQSARDQSQLVGVGGFPARPSEASGPGASPVQGQIGRLLADITQNRGRGTHYRVPPGTDPGGRYSRTGLRPRVFDGEAFVGAPTCPSLAPCRRRQARWAPATPVAFGQTMTAATRDAIGWSQG
jgi:hypothetical protein